MAEKTINNLRIINKHDTEENWLKATGFTPKQGELIVYDIDDNYNYERIKIGDGVQNVNDLPFVDDNAIIHELPVTREEEFYLDTSYGGYVQVINLEELANNSYYSYHDFYKNGKVKYTKFIIACDDGTEHVVLTESVLKTYYVTGVGSTFIYLRAVGQSHYYGINCSDTSTADNVVVTRYIDYLTANNTYEYTPTSNYNPATKKYVDDSIDAIPTPDVSGQIETHNTNETAHSDIRTAINDVSALVGDTSVSEQIEAANIIYVGPDMPTDPNIKVWINTAEEGTGIVPVLPRVATITLAAASWSGSSAPYSQVVEISTVTSATKIDLQPTVAQITELQNADIALMAENIDGVVTIYSFGGKPSSDMTMQVLLTEVSYV